MRARGPPAIPGMCVVHARRSMFSKLVETSWGWDASTDTFPVRMHTQLQQLKSCNESLYMNPQLLNSLPDDELFDYVHTCAALPGAR